MQVSEKLPNRPKPVVLIVLDGWGITQPFSGNAISQADTPVMNKLIAQYPSMTLRASGEAVGLPWGEMGNSEVGHLNLGLGRIFYQELPRINKAISDGAFYKNKAFLKAIEHVKKNNSQLHLLGLVSNGCVHSSIEHLHALLVLAKAEKADKVYIHAILDGRDTAYNSGPNFIAEIERSIAEYGVGEIATVSGRFYTMDRDNHWDRIAKAYLAMTEGKGNRAASASEAIEESYKKKIYDEEFAPTIIDRNGQTRVKDGLISENDAVIFFNYRADRARQITKAFVLPAFEKFERPKYLKNLFFVAFTEYEKDLPIEVAFGPQGLKNTLGEIIAKAGLKQLRLAETEKYAHVTYFFNGGSEIESSGEEHDLISSPPVASYDLKPEMSAIEVTDKLVKAIDGGRYDFILVNYANADMVAHTGNMKATVKAIEVLDKCLGRAVNSVLAKGGSLIITADHGNAEVVFNMQVGIIDKEHSSNPVPLIIAGKQFEGRSIGMRDAVGGDLSLVQPQGILSDVAPTILKIMGLEKPREMTGRSLI
jgi:2,3-bisphosphoglycerate-independent phosphoglycerate mutase